MSNTDRETALMLFAAQLIHQLNAARPSCARIEPLPSDDDDARHFPPRFVRVLVGEEQLLVDVGYTMTYGMQAYKRFEVRAYGWRKHKGQRHSEVKMLRDFLPRQDAPQRTFTVAADRDPAKAAKSLVARILDLHDTYSPQFSEALRQENAAADARNATRAQLTELGYNVYSSENGFGYHRNSFMPHVRGTINYDGTIEVQSLQITPAEMAQLTEILLNNRKAKAA